MPSNAMRSRPGMVLGRVGHPQTVRPDRGEQAVPYVCDQAALPLDRLHSQSIGRTLAHPALTRIEPAWVTSIIRSCSSENMGASVGSTMIGIHIDRSDPALLHDQVAGDIRRAIADGEAEPGEKLPPARDLAAVLGVNTNTVLRALRLLRDEGLLEFQRGRGITVAGKAPERSVVFTKARELVQVARREGFRRDDLVRLIESIP
jgi:GntR family transcriptional regulator